MRVLWMAFGVGLVACAGSGDVSQETQDSDSEATWQPPEGGVITLTTRDEVELVGDYYPAPTQGRPGVVLVHMVPPAWDRTSWPASFIDALVAREWSVIAFDRRGAGDSGGVAREAYEGDKGRYDVEAAALRLAADGYGALAVIGASNGTTSTLDYALLAQEQQALPRPAALGMMTGGSYTENQHRMSELPAVPVVFTYSTAERGWSVAQQPLDPGSWVFHEYGDGAHGTQMFGSPAAEAVRADLAAFLEANLGAD